MPGIIAIALVIVLAIVALAAVSAVAHILFSPWLLVLAVGILAWIKFGPRRSQR